MVHRLLNRTGMLESGGVNKIKVRVGVGVHRQDNIFFSLSEGLF